MAMELFVLSDDQLDSMDEWQAAIDRERFPLRLNSEKPINVLKGFLSVSLRGIATGFECSRWSAESFMRERSSIDFGHEWSCVLAFRWGGNLSQVPAVWMAATAYAKATNGVVFDEDQAKIFSAADAQTVVVDIEREMPEVEVLLRNLTARTSSSNS